MVSLYNETITSPPDSDPCTVQELGHRRALKAGRPTRRGARRGETEWERQAMLERCSWPASWLQKKIHTGVSGVVSEASLHSSSPISCGDLEQVTDVNKASVSSSAKYRPHRIAVSIKWDNTCKTFSNLTHSKCTISVSFNIFWLRNKFNVIQNKNQKYNKTACYLLTPICHVLSTLIAKRPVDFRFSPESLSLFLGLAVIISSFSKPFLTPSNSAISNKNTSVTCVILNN